VQHAHTAANEWLGSADGSSKQQAQRALTDLYNSKQQLKIAVRYLLHEMDSRWVLRQAGRHAGRLAAKL
jgi:hypothetical protein